MAASSRSRVAAAGVAARAALVGTALGTLAFVGGGLLLTPGAELLSGTAGLVATLMVALAAGLWVGAPAASGDPASIGVRWLGAGIAIGVAGGFATLWTVLPQVSDGVLGRSLAFVLLLGAPVYALGIVVPSLLALAEEGGPADAGVDDDGDGEDDEGPRWGAAGTVAIGVLGGAALGAVLAAVVLVSIVNPGPLLLGLGALVIVPALFSRERPVVQGERFLFEQETPFHTLRVMEVHRPERQPERRLFVDDEEESAEMVRSGAPTLDYISAAEHYLTATTPPGASYLCLGGGAYTLPRRIAERDPRARLVTVELDPEVTRVAYRYFGLRTEHRVASLHGDARAWVETVEEAGYDRIFADVYDGREALPYALVTVEGLSAMARALAPGGQLVMNTIGVTDGEGALRFWSTVRTVMEVFPSVALYLHRGMDFPDRQNVLVVASAEREAPFAPRAGHFERLPREGWPVEEGAIVFRDRFPAAGAEREAGLDVPAPLPGKVSGGASASARPSASSGPA